MVVTIVVQYFVVESSSFINAFSKLNDEVIGKLIEQEEENRDIARKVRKKLLSKLRCSVEVEGGTMEVHDYAIIDVCCGYLRNVSIF
jgi:hypothetical protein